MERPKRRRERAKNAIEIVKYSNERNPTRCSRNVVIFCFNWHRITHFHDKQTSMSEAHIVNASWHCRCLEIALVQIAFGRRHFICSLFISLFLLFSFFFRVRNALVFGPNAIVSLSTTCRCRQHWIENDEHEQIFKNISFVSCLHSM